MEINNGKGKTIFEIDDFTLLMVLCIIAFMVVGHC